MFEKKQTLTLKVSDMHCDHCRAKVEKALLAVKGVTAAAVSLENETATVTFREGKATPEELVAAVTAAGFGASVR